MTECTYTVRTRQARRARPNAPAQLRAWAKCETLSRQDAPSGGGWPAVVLGSCNATLDSCRGMRDLEEVRLVHPGVLLRIPRPPPGPLLCPPGGRGALALGLHALALH